jgi:dihydropteroate synthase
VPSVAAALLAVDKGAAIVRVHDVKETVAALKIWAATQAALVGQAGSIT